MNQRVENRNQRVENRKYRTVGKGAEEKRVHGGVRVRHGT